MLFEIIILLLGIPIGYLIAWLARDELVMGRKYFRILVISGILTGIWFWLTGFFVETWTSAFIVIVSLVSLVKSRDKKRIRNKQKGLD